LTLVGSVANLIVTQRAQAHNVTLGFWEYFKVGAPLTMLTILFGAWASGGLSTHFPPAGLEIALYSCAMFIPPLAYSYNGLRLLRHLSAIGA
jgi:hypothetical protein